VALSSARLRKWLTAELSGLDLLVAQIDGILPHPKVGVARSTST
jgi:hypothetical protein